MGGPGNQRRLVGLSGLLAVALLMVPVLGPAVHGTGAEQADGRAARRSAEVGRPLLIKHGWDIPSPAFVHAHVRQMESMPFDGVIIALPGLSDRVERGTPISRAEFARALEPLARTTFTSLLHNFVIVYAAPFDGRARPGVSAANFARLAGAARDAGLEGIAYDNEEYFGTVSDHPDACPGRPVAQCRTDARARGRRTMDAMRSEWPSVRVLTFLGPWVSEPATARRLMPEVAYSDVSGSTELMGSFFVGMAESAVGTTAQVIDGGEIFTARTPADFEAVHRWQKHGMPERSRIIPRSLAPRWSDTVDASFGVFDKSYGGVAMTSAGWRTALTNALRRTDRYVWAYTERFDWWGTGWPRERVTPQWVEAARSARDAIARR